MLPFPFSKGGLPKWLNQAYFNNDIQKFVQEVVEDAISSSIKSSKMMDTIDIVNEEEQAAEQQQTPEKEPLHATVFESHDHVYVKLFVKDSNALDHMKIFHNSNQLIIEGIPAIGDRQVIPLPSIVKMKESVSEYRDNYLQIKMSKREDPQFTEVAVPPKD